MSASKPTILFKTSKTSKQSIDELASMLAYIHE